MKKGDYYVGNAVINFYINRDPKEGELFINSNALAISKLTVNDQVITTDDAFKNQRIPMNKPHVLVGWNTVQLSYLGKYSTNCVGLHTYMDQGD